MTTLSICNLALEIEISLLLFKSVLGLLLALDDNANPAIKAKLKINVFHDSLKFKS